MNTAPIVVGVDGSPSADLALGWAADEARLRHVPLKLVYVVDSPGRAARTATSPTR
ncbi:universal stress protein [Catellatospora coxensis]